MFDHINFIRCCVFVHFGCAPSILNIYCDEYRWFKWLTGVWNAEETVITRSYDITATSLQLYRHDTTSRLGAVIPYSLYCGFIVSSATVVMVMQTVSRTELVHAWWSHTLTYYKLKNVWFKVMVSRRQSLKLNDSLLVTVVIDQLSVEMACHLTSNFIGSAQFRYRALHHI